MAKTLSERLREDGQSGDCVLSTSRTMLKAARELDRLNLALADAEARARWISVRERLPENGVEVFAWMNPVVSDGGFVIDKYVSHDGGWQYTPENSVTHWMPLPEPPTNPTETRP